MLEYLTKDGDTVDYIVWKQYGSTDNRVVEQVLAANKGISELGPVLPAGTLINFPAIIQAEPIKAKVKLWD